MQGNIHIRNFQNFCYLSKGNIMTLYYRESLIAAEFHEETEDPSFGANSNSEGTTLSVPARQLTS